MTSSKQDDWLSGIEDFGDFRANLFRRVIAYTGDGIGFFHTKGEAEFALMADHKMTFGEKISKLRLDYGCGDIDKEKFEREVAFEAGHLVALLDDQIVQQRGIRKREAYEDVAGGIWVEPGRARMSSKNILFDSYVAEHRIIGEKWREIHIGFFAAISMEDKGVVSIDWDALLSEYERKVVRGCSKKS